MDVSHECPQTLNASGASIHEVGNLETAKALDDERFFVNLRVLGGIEKSFSGQEVWCLAWGGVYTEQSQLVGLRRGW